MALEDLTGPSKFISDLVITNPPISDDLEEGAGHIKGIKNAIKNTFPNINGSTSVSDEELNKLAGAVAEVLAFLDAASIDAARVAIGLPSVTGNAGKVAQVNAAGSAWEAVFGIPIGSMMLWPTETAPTNWLICDGSAISRTTYSILHALLKDVGGVDAYAYGNGDGSTTFNLPDFRGRSPIGAGTGTATRASEWTLGEKPTSGIGGEESHIQTTAELAAHTHTKGATDSGVNVSTGAGNNHFNDTGNTGSTGSSSPFNVTHPVLGTNIIIRALL